ncbi:MAG: XRE family transcriptional regulator [Clostridia bacterium]|nr:XRE family transcriptional regulator [Clostridia bacterium]
MIDMEIIGNRIRNLRQQSSLTQAEFAEILGVSFQAVSNWERGIAPPDLDNLMRIAIHFGVLTDDILRPNCEECCLGIDGGGTKTEFVLTDSNGTVIKRILKSGCNPNDIGIDKTTEIIRDGINNVLADHPFLKNVFLGISGITVSNHSDVLKNELQKRFPALSIQVQSDIFNLFGIDGNVNMAVISGTGSVVFVRQNGEYRRIGGWGHLLDRAGSAYDIGRDALSLALREEDTLQAPSPINLKLRKKFRTDTVWEQLNTVYKEGKPYIASLASVVFDAYREGDENAARIIDVNAQALAELLNVGVDIYGAKPEAIANGGIFTLHSDIVSNHMSKYSNIKLLISDLPPIYGACKMAYTMNGAELPTDFHQNFKKTYGWCENEHT